MYCCLSEFLATSGALQGVYHCIHTLQLLKQEGVSKADVCIDDLAGLLHRTPRGCVLAK